MPPSPSDPPRPPGPAPGAPLAEVGSSPTDEVPPLLVGSRLQPKNFPAWGKWIGAALVAIATSVAAAWGVLKPVVQDYEAIAAKRAADADARAKQAKNASEGGYQVTKEYVQSLEARQAAAEAHLVAIEAAIKRLQPASRPVIRRPLPVIPPSRPAPLPRDLNAAEAQISKAAPPSQGPPPTKPADAGP